MTSLTDMETRIRVLEDIEAIRQLKARYWRSLDNKLWDEYADCFTDDLVFEAPPHMEIEGKKAFVECIKEMFDRESVQTTHHGHQSEIETVSQTTAKGIWALRDYHTNFSANTAVSQGRGYYEEEYIKENGKWKIKNMRLTYLVHGQVQSRGDGPGLASQ